MINAASIQATTNFHCKVSASVSVWFVILMLIILHENILPFHVFLTVFFSRLFLLPPPLLHRQSYFFSFSFVSHFMSTVFFCTFSYFISSWCKSSIFIVRFFVRRTRIDAFLLWVSFSPFLFCCLFSRFIGIIFFFCCFSSNARQEKKYLFVFTSVACQSFSFATCFIRKNLFPFEDFYFSKKLSLTL